MLQLFAQEPVANDSIETPEHVENSVPSIAPQLPSPTQDALSSIRIGLRDVANETARNIQQLSQATVEQALEIGQRLWQMQRDLKRKEYGAVLGILGWASAKARKYINLAKTFADFSPAQLMRVELTTLLSLCQARYSSVVAQLREVKDITQQLVEHLIKENRIVRSPKQDPITGWKRNRAGGGRRYEVILHDEVTGLSIEQQAEAEGVLPQRVIAEAVAARYEQKSNGSVQVSEYRAAQLEELPVVVEHARNLDAENRRLMYQLLERDRRIAELESKLRENAVASSEEQNDVLELANQRSVEPGISDEVAMPVRACASRIASTELNEYLESQVRAIAKEYTAEHLSQTAEATDYSEAEQESSNLATPHSGGAAAQQKDYLVEPKDGGHALEVEPQLIHVGASVKIVSERQGTEFVGLQGLVLVANTSGCVVEVLDKTKWFCNDEIVLLSAVPQVSSEQEKDAAPAIKPSAG